MCQTNLLHAWASLVGSLAVIAIMLTALGLMVGLVKPADALKYAGAVVGIAIVLVMIVSSLVALWSNLSLWQRAVLFAVGSGVWRLRRGRQPQRKKKEED